MLKRFQIYILNSTKILSPIKIIIIVSPKTQFKIHPASEAYSYIQCKSHSIIGKIARHDFFFTRKCAYDCFVNKHLSEVQGFRSVSLTSAKLSKDW